MPVSIQVTLGSGATQISKHGINFKQMIIQNNTSADSVRAGDSTVVAGAYGTGKGILIPPSSNMNWGPTVIQGGILSNWYLAGTLNDVIDVTYEPG
jgi:hypothetical protein